MQYVNAEASPGGVSHERKRVELDLPIAMKLWRNRSSKYMTVLPLQSRDSPLFFLTVRYLSILYNDEASASESSQDAYASRLYLSPVLFDAEVKILNLTI